MVHLVTVSNSRLKNIASVRKRVRELRPYATKGSTWRRVVELTTLPSTTSLPDQMAFLLGLVLAAVCVARTNQSRSIAFGYTGYQSHWLEQSQYSIDSLALILKKCGFSLILPTIELSEKAQAIWILRCLGLSTDSLEQTSPGLDPELSLSEAIPLIDRWAEIVGPMIAKKALRNPLIEFLRWR